MSSTPDPSARRPAPPLPRPPARSGGGTEATFRLYLFELTPDATALAPTLRFELGDAAEQWPSEHEMLMRARVDDPRAALARLVGALDRFHPDWRRLATLERPYGGGRWIAV